MASLPSTLKIRVDIASEGDSDAGLWFCILLVTSLQVAHRAFCVKELTERYSSNEQLGFSKNPLHCWRRLWKVRRSCIGMLAQVSHAIVQCAEQIPPPSFLSSPAVFGPHSLTSQRMGCARELTASSKIPDHWPFGLLALGRDEQIHQWRTN